MASFFLLKAGNYNKNVFREIVRCYTTRGKNVYIARGHIEDLTITHNSVLRFSLEV